MCERYLTNIVHCIVKKKFYFVPLGVVVVVVHIIFPDEPEKISFLLAVDFCHAPQSVWENALAPLNIAFMLVTLDTSHLEMSPLNDDAEWNMSSMLVTLETSHLEMSPLNDETM